MFVLSLKNHRSKWHNIHDLILNDDECFTLIFHDYDHDF